MGLPTIHYQPTSYCSGRTLCELTATEVGLRNSGKSKKKMATWITLQPPISYYLRLMPSSAPSPASSTSRRKQRRLFKPFRCVPLQEQEPQLDQSQQGDDNAVILCEDCNGKGWLLCDFCKGQKTNVKSENNRIYRRCPTCKAVGFVLCRKCKVFKCVTFPNSEDGDELLF